MKKFPIKIFVTTPLFYPSGKPHIGHALSYVIADLIARHYKRLGTTTTFITGTDNHGQKIHDLAIKKQQIPQDYLLPYVNKFINLANKLQIMYTDFIQTSLNSNMIKSESIFQTLKKKIWFILVTGAPNIVLVVKKIN